MSSLSREAILAVLSGLTVVACDKSPSVQAEPAASTQAHVAAAAAPSATALAKEVPSAQGAGAEKEKSCAPGGCAPGQCGAKK